MSAAELALLESQQRLRETHNTLADLDDHLFTPLRGKLERNHFADKLRAIIL